MNSDVFDLIEPEGESGYMELASKAPAIKDNSFFNTVADYGRTALKGAVEGLTNLGHMMGPTQEYPKFKEGKLVPGRTSEQVLEQQTEGLNELLPTDEGFGQKALRRGLKMAPSVGAFPGANPLSSSIRSGVAGLAGQGVEELGGGEIAQTLAELTAFIGPELTKKLFASGKNKEIMQFAKKMGMTDEQITPLIQGETKQKWLSKLTSKGKSTQNRLAESKKGIEKIYKSVESSPEAALEISEMQNGKLINEIFKKLESMPRDAQSKIEADLSDLLNNKITGNSLINFWRDINSKYTLNKQQLQTIKEPLKNALKSISPDLAQDFEMTNKLFSKYYPISSKLKPDLASKIVSAAESIGSVGSVIGAMLGHPYPLLSIIGKKAGSKLSSEMLLNPRFQQIGKKMVLAINQNKWGMAKKLIDLYAHEVKEISPKLSEELNDISEEDMMDFFYDLSEKENQ